MVCSAYAESASSYVFGSVFLRPITLAHARVGVRQTEFLARSAVVGALQKGVVVEHLLDLAGQLQR